MKLFTDAVPCARPSQGEDQRGLLAVTGLRCLLLASVAMGSLSLAVPPAARAAAIVPPAAPCNTVSGAIVTCTGDLSAGVFISAASNYSVLNINSLTANAGAIRMVRAGNLTLNSDSGSKTILGGIDVLSGAVATVTSQGSIDTTNETTWGILAQGDLGVDIKSSGTITTDGANINPNYSLLTDAIFGTSSGPVTIDNAATITSRGARGIYAEIRSLAANGDTSRNITITNTGTITAQDHAIEALICVVVDGPDRGCGHISQLGSYGHDLKISNSGNLSSHRNGIVALRVQATGEINISNSATIESDGMGISANDLNPSAGNRTVITNSGTIRSDRVEDSLPNYGGISTFDGTEVIINNTGTIDSRTGPGILSVFGQSISITNSGSIVSGSNYFGGTTSIESFGVAVSVDNSGEISSRGVGIWAEGEDGFGGSVGTALVTNSGTIDAQNVGIRAVGKSPGQSTTVRQTGGTISSATRSGIVAGSLFGSATVEIGGQTTGAAGYAAVEIFNGVNNALTVNASGVLRNAGGINELAILAGSGNEAVSNAGTVSGNIALGSGANSVTNLAAGRFNMGSSIDLGGSGAEDFTNAGTLSMGGSGAIMATGLTGDLFLASSSLLDFDLGAANVVGGPLNDLLTVSGNLTLDGNVAVAEAPGGSFTAGVYRLINYGGSLINNGLSILGALPNGLSGTIQTSIAGQVNLIATSGGPVDIAYWDGPNVTPGGVPGGRGGTSVWNSPTNWTSEPGTVNSTWDSGVGVFGGAAGTVTVEGTQSFVGLQFVTNGYLLQTGAGGALDLTTGGFIFVDKGLDATVDVGIAGTGALFKQGDGRLVLSEANSFEGGAAITAGTLAAGSGEALGRGAATISDGATLQAAVDGVTLANVITIGDAGPAVGTIDTQGYGFTLAGTLRGAGTARKTGTGTLVLRGTDSGIGGLAVTAGALTNQGTLGVNGTALMAADTLLTNSAGARLAVTGGVAGDDGIQTIDNAGLLQAAIDLRGGNDVYRLRATGSQAGVVDGGAGWDALALNAGTGGRTIAEGDYQNFEDLTLNAEDGAAGRVVLAGAASPANRATLDLGPTGTARLLAGELNLATATSSLRTGSLTTAAGSRLSGNGAVIGDLAMAGTIAPGNSIGTLTVAGDYVQTGTYDVEISHVAGAAPGLSLSDQIVTQGAVSFGGSVDVSIAADSSLEAIKAVAADQGAMRWRILDGSTPIATDARTARLAAPDGLALGLDYVNGGEDVDLFLAWAAPPQVSEQAGMLWQVALQQPDLALCDGTAEDTAERSCAFLQGTALSVDDDAAQDGDATGWSGVAGGGGELRPDLWLGAGAGYRAGDIDGGDYDRLAAYLWGTWSPGAAEFKGFAGFGHYAVDGSRSTVFGETASWDYGAWQPYLAAQGRYWMDLGETIRVTPVAGVTSVWLAMPEHGETGAGIENFRVTGQDLWGLTTLLGAEARWQMTPDLAMEASAGWQHLFGDDTVDITGSYDGIPGADFNATSDAVDRDQAALGLGVLAQITDTALLRLDYDATISADQFTQSGFARVTFAW